MCLNFTVLTKWAGMAIGQNYLAVSVLPYNRNLGVFIMIVTFSSLVIISPRKK